MDQQVHAATKGLAIHPWDKRAKQSVIQTIDVGKGAVAREIRVEGELIGRPVSLGERMVLAVQTPDK